MNKKIFSSLFCFFNRGFWVAAVLSFALVFGIFYGFFNRYQTARFFQKETLSSINRLNDLYLDIAYDKVKISYIPGTPLAEFENLSLYSMTDKISLNIPQAKITPSLLHPSQYIVSLGKEQTLTWKDKKYQIQNNGIEIELQINGNIKTILTNIQQIEVKNILKIQEIKIASRSLNSQKEDAAYTPSHETYLEMDKLDFDGLLNYPLTSRLDHLYLKARLIGKINKKGNLLSDIRDWLGKDGYIDISSLTLNWKPLLLVGRGSLLFNENLSPRLHLSTSSKGMLSVIDDLQKKNFIESKGAFVTKIILKSKAFKLKSEDTELAVITPIDYRDGRFAIENLTVKTLTPLPRQ